MIWFLVATAVAVAGGWFIAKYDRLDWVLIPFGIVVGALMSSNEVVCQAVLWFFPHTVEISMLYTISIVYFILVATLTTLVRVGAPR